MWSFNTRFLIGRNKLQIKDQPAISNDILMGIHSNETTKSSKSPVEPVKPEQFSIEDFLGDKYAIDDDMPKTVSISATIFIRLGVLVLHVGAQ